MMHNIWRSALAALALVSLSACAVEATTADGTIADDSQPDGPSSPVVASEHDGPDVASTGARPNTNGLSSPVQGARAMPDDPNGPYPEPWSGRRSDDGKR